MNSEMKESDYTKEQLKLVGKVADDVFAYGEITFPIKKSDWYGFVKNAFTIAQDKIPVKNLDLKDALFGKYKSDKIIEKFEASNLLID